MAQLKDVQINRVDRRRGNQMRFFLTLVLEIDGQEETVNQDFRITQGANETFNELVSRLIEENTDTFNNIIEQKVALSDESNLFALVEYHRDNIEEWEAPEGAHDAPNMGDLRIHNDVIWKSTMDGNITEPSEDSQSEWDKVMDIPGTNNG